jgi:hypothetical protein
MADETTTTPHGTTIVGDKAAQTAGGGQAEGSTSATSHTPQPAAGPRPGGANSPGGALDTGPEPKGGMGSNQ